MFEAVDIEDILFTLRSLQRRKEIPPQGRLLIGLLFSRPSLPLAKTDIIPNLEYIHRRAALHMHFFCPGFAFNDQPRPCSYWDAKDYKNISYEERHNINHNRLNYYFSDIRFIDCVKEIEDKTKWIYSGESDLLIFQAIANKKTTSIDYTSAISCSLETLMRNNIIPSLPQFFERLICDAKPVHNYTTNQSLTNRISDIEGWRYGSKSIAEWMLSLIPGNKHIKRNSALLNQLRVQDISVKES